MVLIKVVGRDEMVSYADLCIGQALYDALVGDDALARCGYDDVPRDALTFHGIGTDKALYPLSAGDVVGASSKLNNGNAIRIGVGALNKIHAIDVEAASVVLNALRPLCPPQGFPGVIQPTSQSLSGSQYESPARQVMIAKEEAILTTKHSVMVVPGPEDPSLGMCMAPKEGPPVPLPLDSTVLTLKPSIVFSECPRQAHGPTVQLHVSPSHTRSTPQAMSAPASVTCVPKKQGSTPEEKQETGPEGTKNLLWGPSALGHFLGEAAPSPCDNKIFTLSPSTAITDPGFIKEAPTPENLIPTSQSRTNLLGCTTKSPPTLDDASVLTLVPSIIQSSECIHQTVLDSSVWRRGTDSCSTIPPPPILSDDQILI